jgi:hypothetical protein
MKGGKTKDFLLKIFLVFPMIPIYFNDFEKNEN